MKKRVTITALVVCMLLTTLLPPAVQAKAPTAKKILAKAVKILEDTETISFTRTNTVNYTYSDGFRSKQTDISIFISGNEEEHFITLNRVEMDDMEDRWSAEEVYRIKGSKMTTYLRELGDVVWTKETEDVAYGTMKHNIATRLTDPKRVTKTNTTKTTYTLKVIPNNNDVESIIVTIDRASGKIIQTETTWKSRASETLSGEWIKITDEVYTDSEICYSDDVFKIPSSLE